MKPNKKLLKLALTGLLAGASLNACKNKTTSPSNESNPTTRTAFEKDCEDNGGSLLSHDCQGLNECKGSTLLDGAETATQHDCKGENSCKGVTCLETPSEEQNSSVENTSSASEVTPEAALRQFQEDCEANGGTFSEKNCQGQNECKGTTLATGATEKAEHSCKGNSSCAGALCEGEAQTENPEELPVSSGLESSSASEITPETALRQFQEDCELNSGTFSEKSCQGQNDCKGAALATGATEATEHSCKGHSTCAGAICQ